MIKFAKVKRFAAADFNLPVRKTERSAGYDFEVAEDITIPPMDQLIFGLSRSSPVPVEGYTLEEIAQLTKTLKTKPTLVSTGVKCYLDPGYYLELSVRSSTPLKYWLILANGVGIIDADYADNEDNEGEIFFQLINLSPYPIALKKGDIIGQGIIKKYYTTDNDIAAGQRTGGLGSTSNALQMATDSGNAVCGARGTIGVYDDYAGRGVREEISNSIRKGIDINLNFEGSFERDVRKAVRDEFERAIERAIRQ